MSTKLESQGLKGKEYAYKLTISKILFWLKTLEISMPLFYASQKREIQHDKEILWK